MRNYIELSTGSQSMSLAREQVKIDLGDQSEAVADDGDISRPSSLNRVWGLQSELKLALPERSSIRKVKFIAFATLPLCHFATLLRAQPLRAWSVAYSRLQYVTPLESWQTS